MMPWDEPIKATKPFIKHDAGKLRFDLIDPEFEAELADILTIGAKVYSPDNWKYAEPTEARARYYAAFRRHMNKWFAGESTDPDSGKPHLICAACCLMFLRWFERGDQVADIEDGATSEELYGEAAYRCDAILPTYEYTDPAGRGPGEP
jgi:hypothetical protein